MHQKPSRAAVVADLDFASRLLVPRGEVDVTYWAALRFQEFRQQEQAHSSPVAREALQRIGGLYGIEEPIHTNSAADGLWKRREVESPKPDFPTSLGNPANDAGFPLSHRPDGGCLFNSNRTTHVLRKPDTLTC